MKTPFVLLAVAVTSSAAVALALGIRSGGSDDAVASPAAPAAVLAGPATESGSDPSCSAPVGHTVAPGHPATTALPEEEVTRVADHVARHLASHPTTLPELEEIEAATGVRIGGRIEEFKAAVVGRLEKTHPDLLARYTRDNRCSQYEACSLHGDLASAGGETLDMYAREKKEDGTTFADHALPAFEAETLSGERVRSRTLKGRPTVLAFVAVHCGHSLDSLPILQEVQEAYADRGLRVLAVYVNSGDAATLRAWLPLNFDVVPSFAVWAVEGASLGDLVGSHLVPTYLTIDASGEVRRKLVGFKDRAAVIGAVEELLATARK